MINRDEILQAIKPFVMQWIQSRMNMPALGSGSSGGAETNLVKVSADDAIGRYLDEKLVAGTGISKTVVDPGLDETLQLAFTLDHGTIGGLGDDDHTQYLNTTRHAAIDHTSLVHAAATVADTSTIDMSITGQQISGSVIQSGLDHGSISGLGDDDHSAVYPGLAQTETISGGWTFTSTLNTHSILPTATDAYDLGSSSLLWRKGWLSELDTVVFAENTITLLGGWFWVTKGQGVLAYAVAAADTNIDFGISMTVGDFVVFRSSLAVEYMQIGSNIAGYRYNVTRNLDGSGANDWVAGSPFATLGASGNGRIELNAYDTPRMSILKQGATYNATTELLRLGDLNGSYGISSELYGIGLGDYSGGNYLRYDPTNNFLLKAGAGSVSIDNGGIRFVSGTNQTNMLQFQTGSTLDAAVYGYVSSGVTNAVLNAADSAGGMVHIARATLRADNADSLTANNASVDGTFGLRLYQSPGSGNVHFEYTGDLYAKRNSTDYVGYIFTPLETPLTSTSWDGDSHSTTSATVIDLSSVFGAPAGIKAALVRIEARDSAAWGSSGLYIALGPSSSYYYTLTCPVFGGDVSNFVEGIVPCDSNGDIYYRIIASGTNTMDVDMRIFGYFL